MRKIRAGMAALVLAAPLMANADLIQFDWTSNGAAGALVSGSGYWVIDEADLTPGFGNYASIVADFSFEWTTTNNAFSVSQAAGHFAGELFLTFDNALNLTSFRTCFLTVDDPSEDCAAKTERPLILVRTNLWGATGGADDPNAGSNNTNFVFETPQTVTVSRVQTVPEPGTLGLLGVGLAAIGFARHRKKG